MSSCCICSEGGYESILFDGDSIWLCEEHINMVEDRIGLEDVCVFCDGMPSNELEFANKRIGDYEAGVRPNIIRLCDNHLEDIK
jgi:hypothetical protein